MGIPVYFITYIIPSQNNRKGGNFLFKEKLLKEKMTGILSLPREIALDKTMITLMGRGEVNIENYKSILEFSDTKIRLRTKEGDLEVLGERLKMSQATAEDIVITGRIKAINLD